MIDGVRAQTVASGTGLAHSTVEMKHVNDETGRLGERSKGPAEWPYSIGTSGALELTELVLLAYHDGGTPLWINLGSDKPLKLVMRDLLQCCILRASENQHASRRQQGCRNSKANVHWGE